jgi:hypothetical protein
MSFAFRALTQNLNHHNLLQLSIVASADKLPKMSADMIVCDGNLAPEVFDAIRPGTILFVEGKRRQFRKQCLQYLADHNLSVSFAKYGPLRLQWDYWPRFRIPMLKWVKGCWIGQVTKRAESC